MFPVGAIKFRVLAATVGLADLPFLQVAPFHPRSHRSAEAGVASELVNSLI